MNILIACERSGRVREAFRAKGHNAWSCDIEPADDGSKYHFQWDVLWYLYGTSHNLKWDMVIAHPPCTHIAVCGNKHYAGTQLRQEAADFINTIWQAPVDKLCIENPVGQINTYLPDMPRPQYIQPWQFGHGETKKTGLWKRGLPDLEPTDIVEGREQRIWKMGPSPTRSVDRSITYQGIANAMANQWG